LRFLEAFIQFVNENLLTPHWGGSFYPACIGSGVICPFLPYMFFWDTTYAKANALFSKFKADTAKTGCWFNYVMQMAPSMTVQGETFASLYPDFIYGPTLKTGKPGQFVYTGYTAYTSYNYMASYYSAYVPMTDFSDAKGLAKKLTTVGELYPYAYLSTGKALGGEVFNNGEDISVNPKAYESGSLLIAGFFVQGYWPGREPTSEALTIQLKHIDSISYLEQLSGRSFPYKCTCPWKLSKDEVVECWKEFDDLVKGCTEHFESDVWPKYRELFRMTGSYANEADWSEPNWQEQFWGTNYQRLFEIKQKVDPTGLFVCHHCVGSEDWSDDGNCFTPVANGNNVARDYWLPED